MQFELKALSARQEVISLTLDAANQNEATEQAKRLGHVVLSVKKRTAFRLNTSRVKSGFPLVLFSQELHSLLDAGLSLMESMETLREKEHRPEVRLVFDQVMAALYDGLPFSSALEKAEGVFPALFVALMRSSQETGDLPEALARYVNYQTQVNLVRKKIVSSSIYPALLLIVGGLVILFLMLYVVPKFSVIYENQKADLPWLSQGLLAWGRLLHDHAQEVFMAVAGVIGLLAFSLSRQVVRQRLQSLFWSIPTLGERLRIYQLARFYRTLGMLLRGGIPVVAALGMVSGLLQSAMRENLQLARQDIREGIAISVAMENRALTTPVAVRMLRVGERSGQMGELMERIGSFYDDEIAQWLDWFTRLFEPILMTVIGLVIGVIVMLMYMPIFELAGSIQ